MLIGQSVLPELIGIAAGHLYYYLSDIYPLQTGRRLVATPNFVKTLLSDMGVRGPLGGAAPAVQRERAPFQGRGRRLAD
jgi:Derlin-2/3